MGRKIVEKLRSLVKKNKIGCEVARKCCHDKSCGCKGDCVCENGPFK